MMFTREDVLSLVDAAFHAYACDFRGEAEEFVSEMMDEREAVEKAEKEVQMKKD